MQTPTFRQVPVYRISSKNDISEIMDKKWPGADYGRCYFKLVGGVAALKALLEFKTKLQRTKNVSNAAKLRSSLINYGFQNSVGSIIFCKETNEWVDGNHKVTEMIDAIQHGEMICPTEIAVDLISEEHLPIIDEGLSRSSIKQVQMAGVNLKAHHLNALNKMCWIAEAMVAGDTSLSTKDRKSGLRMLHNGIDVERFLEVHKKDAGWYTSVSDSFQRRLDKVYRDDFEGAKFPIAKVYLIGVLMSLMLAGRALEAEKFLCNLEGNLQNGKMRDKRFRTCLLSAMKKLSGYDKLPDGGRPMVEAELQASWALQAYNISASGNYVWPTMFTSFNDKNPLTFAGIKVKMVATPPAPGATVGKEFPRFY